MVARKKEAAEASNGENLAQALEIAAGRIDDLERGYEAAREAQRASRELHAAAVAQVDELKKHNAQLMHQSQALRQSEAFLRAQLERAKGYIDRVLEQYGPYETIGQAAPQPGAVVHGPRLHDVAWPSLPNEVSSGQAGNGDNSWF